MARHHINTGDWIVVCDGRKALILVNRGDEKFLNLQVHEVFEHADPATRTLGSDAPGRVHQSMGVARSAVEQADWHDAAEQTFLHGLVHHIDQAMAKRDAPQAIFVIAAPRALGILRKSYSLATLRKIQVEFSKDYMTLPVAEIERHVIADLKSAALL